MTPLVTPASSCFHCEPDQEGEPMLKPAHIAATAAAIAFLPLVANAAPADDAKIKALEDQFAAAFNARTWTRS